MVRSKFSRLTLISVLAVAACGLFSSGSVRAVPLDGVTFGNLGENNQLPIDPFTVSSVIGTSGTNNIALAQGFISGTGELGSPPYSQWLNIESVILGLGNPSSSPAPTPLVQLWSSSAGAPLAPLATFVGGTITSNDKYTFTLPSPYTLTASTQYYIVVTDQNAGSGSSFAWFASDPATVPDGYDNNIAGPGVSYDYLNTRRSSNGGSSWVNGSVVNQYASITLKAVPEPSTVVMAAAGLTTAGFAIRRHRRKSAARG